MKEIRLAYEVAERARMVGIDHEPRPESVITKDMAERVESLVGPPGIANVIRQLEVKMDREELATRIISLILSGKGEDEQLAEQAVRTALAIVTEGVVTAPMEGVTHVRIVNGKYLEIGFAGPIRAAGGTAAALAVLFADVVRRKLGIPAYRTTKEELNQVWREIELYQRKIAHLQYEPSRKEVELVLRNLPVRVSGEITDRVGATGIRGGMVLVIAEGIILKAKKLLKYAEKFGLGWSWLGDLLKLKREQEETEPRYLKEVIAGRPVYAHPSAAGGFRLRYGRARNTGLAAVGLHPATMELLGLAVGTQLVLQGPGKAGAVAPVDSIEGPIVRTKEGVFQLKSEEEARRVKGEVEEILYLGDILVSVGEFVENNWPLLPAGWCEEWWAQEVRSAAKQIPPELEPYLNPPYPVPPAELALEVSRRFGVPLHPRYTYFYSLLPLPSLRDLAGATRGGKWREDGLEIKGKNISHLLGILGVPHRIVGEETVLVGEEEAKILQLLNPQKLTGTNTLQAVSAAMGVKVMDKAGTWIGARMGRPEKASIREMNPPPHVLFPVGEAGGPQRDIEKASKTTVRVKVVNRVCPACGEPSLFYRCEKCGAETKVIRTCPRCLTEVGEGQSCPNCGGSTVEWTEREIPIGKLLAEARRRTGNRTPELIKGVEGLISRDCSPEHLGKGILRAKHGLFVFRDGTVRFDAPNLPLTHFIPAEIGTGVERLRELGYEVEEKDRPVEMKPEDIVIPEEIGRGLLRLANFIDEELQRLYGQEPFYNLKSLEDLVGHLVVTQAPHTSQGLIQRIIGFSKTQAMYCHPFAIAQRRRNCDGDHDSVTLLMDVLLNFSRHYLPSSRGGLMDAPLVLNTVVNPKEMDREALNIQAGELTLEFYRATLRRDNPRAHIITAEDALKQGKELGFTHPSSVEGPKVCRYRHLQTTEEKIQFQMELAKKIRAVDERDVARRILESHLVPDIVGNLEAYFKQQYRCTRCNRKYRRPPMSGRCLCGHSLIPTVTEGGIRKYLQLAKTLAENHSGYTSQRLELIERYMADVFPRRQTSLADFLPGPAQEKELSLSDFMEE
ncbi:MAG: DNA polymerase II large subunit [Candidatus Hadarchaeales archaeon]